MDVNSCTLPRQWEVPAQATGPWQSLRFVWGPNASAFQGCLRATSWAGWQTEMPSSAGLWLSEAEGMESDLSVENITYLGGLCSVSAAHQSSVCKTHHRAETGLQHCVGS